METIASKVLAGICVVLLVILALVSFGMYHFHSEWVDSKVEVAKLQVSLSQVEATATSCSEQVKKLKEADDIKAGDIQKAQAQASRLAKNNEALAQSLLNTSQSGLDSCAAAVQLYKDYKAGKEIR